MLKCKVCGSTKMERHAKVICCAMCGNIVVRLPYNKEPEEDKFIDIEDFLAQIQLPQSKKYRKDGGARNCRTSGKNK